MRENTSERATLGRPSPENHETVASIINDAKTDQVNHRYSEARRKLRRALKLDRCNVRALNGLGVVLRSMGKPRTALRLFDVCIRVSPQDPRAYINKALYLNDSGRCDLAAETFRAAEKAFVAWHDENASYTGHRLYYNWALNLVSLGDFRDAVAKFRRAAEFDEHDALTYHNLGYYLWLLGRYGQARVSWGKAIELFAKKTLNGAEAVDPEIYAHHAALCHYGFGDLSAAEDVLLKGIAQYPGHVRLQIELGALYRTWKFFALEVDFDAKSERHYREAARLALAAASRTGLEEKALIFLNLGDPDSVITLIQRPLEDSALSPSMWLMVASAHSQTGDHIRAISYARRAVASSGNDPTARHLLADVFQAAGESGRAEHELRILIREAPHNVKALADLAKVLLRSVDPLSEDVLEEARELLSRVISLWDTPESSVIPSPTERAEVFYSLGVTHWKTASLTTRSQAGKYHGAAREYFRACIRNDPKHRKASRAVRELERIRAASRGFEAAQAVTALAAAWMFLLAQYRVVVSGSLAHSESPQYAAVSFGSILLALAGLLLPELLKLKVAAFELELSPHDPSTPDLLWLTRP